jgi:hypothetical protein
MSGNSDRSFDELGHSVPATGDDNLISFGNLGCESRRNQIADAFLERQPAETRHLNELACGQSLRTVECFEDAEALGIRGDLDCSQNRFTCRKFPLSGIGAKRPLPFTRP